MITLLALATAAPIQLSHQGRVLDASGEPVAPTSPLEVVLYGAPSGGPVLHAQAVPTIDPSGYYAVVLGADGDLDSSVLLNPGGVWVQVESDGTALGSRQPLVQVPSAVVATSVAGGPVETSGITVTGSGEVVLGQVVSGTTCTTAGGLVYDTALSTVLVCDGATYIPLAPGTIRIVADGEGRRWSDGSAAATCEDYRRPAGAIRKYEGLTGDARYWIDPNGEGEWLAWCDMTTDNGGWTLLHSVTGGNSQQALVSNTAAGGNPLTFGHYNVSRASKMAVAAESSETLFRRSDGRWLRASAPLFDSGLNTSNRHPHQAVTLTARNGATASATMGYANFQNASGGDFGIRNGAFDHHSSTYLHLQSSCVGHYLYSYSSATADGDAGYDVNRSLGDWSATRSCDSAEGGGLVFRTGMR